MLLMRVHRFDSVSLFSFCFSAWAVFPLFSLLFGPVAVRVGPVARSLICACGYDHIQLVHIVQLLKCRHLFRFNLLQCSLTGCFFSFVLRPGLLLFVRIGSAWRPDRLPFLPDLREKTAKNPGKSRKKRFFKKNAKRGLRRASPRAILSSQGRQALQKGGRKKQC